jgi:tetratricopeptide (TPR) repeat protein
MGWLRDRLGRRADAPIVAASPLPAVDWKAQGNAALAAGNLAEAERCYAQGIRLQADDASLHLNLGYVLLEQGKWSDAVDRLQQALALQQPFHDFKHEACFLLGRAHTGSGRMAQALAAFTSALEAKPDFAEPLQEGARLLHQLGRHAEAAEWAQRLAALRPSSFSWIIAATELALCGRDVEAADFARRVVAEEPRNLEAGVLLFNSLFRLARFQDALAEAERLLGVTGPDPGALVNVAISLEKLGRAGEALPLLEQARALAPSRRDVLVNRVSVLIELLRVDDAVTAAREGLRLHPQDADLHWNLGIALLLRGEFEAGWRESEWRTRSVAYAGQAIQLDAPAWKGETLEGRAIFLYGEQGFGDNIQFIRYLPEVARRARAVYLQVPEPLEPLMQGLAPNCRLLQQGALLPAIDFHCSLMGLPAVLGTRADSIPAAVPYLRADAKRTQAWRERLPRDTFNVGIAWSGKPSHVNDHNRSMTLATFRAIAAEGCRFVTVQPQLRDVDGAVLADWPEALDLGSELRDFADTAALVETLDLVITVDTGVAHLAGALGKPLWILLPHVPDWRWMLEREDSPWYPTARLYRQATANDWPGVLQRVQRDLAARSNP